MSLPEGSQIIININQAGDSKIAVIGLPGVDCKEITKTLESVLGQVEKDTPTREMYEDSNEHEDRYRH